VGHNWEAVPSWFIDKFTTGARFWTQDHRTKVMDPRRITIHLLKGVGGRQSNAEVDRVWEVTMGLFTQPVVYVLECKWGLVSKKHVDDFFEVLKWSKEFGADSSEGRSIKQGVNAIFAASSFNPHENVRLRDGTILSLTSYAGRLNIQLLRSSDFNEKLHEKGCPNNVSVQRICKAASTEGEVAAVLAEMWGDPNQSEEILERVQAKNRGLYEFEERLQVKTGTKEKAFDDE
jgi:hypothetical protein